MVEKSNIRLLLGFDGDNDKDVPDNLIDRFTALEEAEIKTRVPDWETLAGNDLTFFKEALACAVGAALCEPLKQRMPSREKSPFYEQTSNVDWDEKRTFLLSERDRLISKISTQEFTTLYPFVLSGPSR